MDTQSRPDPAALRVEPFPAVRDGLEQGEHREPHRPEQPAAEDGLGDRPESELLEERSVGATLRSWLYERLRRPWWAS